MNSDRTMFTPNMFSRRRPQRENRGAEECERVRERIGDASKTSQASPATLGFSGSSRHARSCTSDGIGRQGTGSFRKQFQSFSTMPSCPVPLPLRFRRAKGALPRLLQPARFRDPRRPLAQAPRQPQPSCCKLRGGGWARARVSRASRASRAVHAVRVPTHTHTNTHTHTLRLCDSLTLRRPDVATL